MKCNACSLPAGMIFLFLLNVQLLSAQNVAPYWSTSGNTNATTVSKIGTVNSVPLRFVTKNTDRIRIDTFGRVGIGTTSPLQLLHVAGNGTLSGNLGIGISVAAQKLHVVGNAAFTGSVGIGTTAPVYKLHVSTTGTAIYGNSTAGNYGVWGNSNYLGVYGSGTSYGVFGSGSYGVYGSGNSYGVYGSGPYGVYGSGSSYGVYGYSSGSYGTYGNSGYVGSYGTASSYGIAGQGGQYGVSGNGSYIGVFGSTSSGTAVVGNSVDGTGANFYSTNATGLIAGTYRADKNWAGVFNGNVYAYGVYAGSDRNIKKNIQSFDDALKIISQLKPRTYEFKREGDFEKMHLPLGKHYGLVAQEVEEILPDLIKEVDFQGPVMGEMPSDSVGSNKLASTAADTKVRIKSKSINYIELIPVVIKALQELSKQNEELQQQVNDLQQTVNRLQHPGAADIPDRSSLSQSQPNPVNGIARVQYSLPKNVNNAQLVITDNLGTVIKSVQLNASGVTDINVSSFSSGIYNYSLVVDNRTVQTRKMTVLK